MIKLAVVLGVLMTFSSVTNGHCPNGCSGHGECGVFDMCDCFTGFIGGDCSKRTCPYETAWVVTNANGDINHDGNVYGGTTYVPNHDIWNSGLDYIVNQANPNGYFESWEHTLSLADKDEGHFYMECSNRGACDRSSGECQCFDGYTGAACERAGCPNGCSGHGQCNTVSEVAGAYTYTLWDAHKATVCSCDPGYTGVDCSKRTCPKGDDPLTTGQAMETQYIDISVDDSGLQASDTALALGGTFKLKFTDDYGKVWTTGAIAVQPVTSSADQDAIAANVEAALLALPNDVIRSVSVSVGFQDAVIPGQIDIAADGTLSAATSGNGAANAAAWADGTDIRCETGSSGEEFSIGRAASAKLQSYGTSLWTDAIAFTATTDTTCYQVANYFGIRIAIKFIENPGSLSPVEVDVSSVTAGGLTNLFAGSSIVTATVTKTPAISITGTGGSTMDYKKPYEIDSAGAVVASNGQLTVTDSSLYFPGQKITVVCNDNAVSVKRGTFTVDSIVDGTHVQLVEDVVDCSSASLTQANWAIRTNVDFTGILVAGQKIYTSSMGTSPLVQSVTFDRTVGEGYIFLTKAFGTADSSSGTGVAVLLSGEGTTENDVCASRGACDEETGLCACFPGYTGFACHLQNALSN